MVDLADKIVILIHEQSYKCRVGTKIGAWTTGEDYFWPGALPLKIYSAILHTKQRQRRQTSAASFIMDGRHPERPPRRAAQPISSADSGERSVAARRSWAAPGLSSGRFVVAAAAICCV